MSSRSGRLSGWSFGSGPFSLWPSGRQCTDADPRASQDQGQYRSINGGCCQDSRIAGAKFSVSPQSAHLQSSVNGMCALLAAHVRFAVSTLLAFFFFLRNEINFAEPKLPLVFAAAKQTVGFSFWVVVNNVKRFRHDYTLLRSALSATTYGSDRVYRYAAPYTLRQKLRTKVYRYIGDNVQLYVLVFLWWCELSRQCFRSLSSASVHLKIYVITEVTPYT